MVSWLLRNAWTAVRHPSIALDYLHWRSCEAIGRPRLVTSLFGARLRVSSFADLRSTRGFVPHGDERTMIERLSAHHPIFIDAGANVGVWCIALATAHPAATVYAFEPTPDSFRLLSDNLKRNRTMNVIPLQMALADSAGTVPIQVNRQMSIYNRLVPTRQTAVDLQRGRFTDGVTTLVEAVSLDEFCRQREIERIGFLKIDVEGAELFVLRGAEQMLRRRAIERLWMEVDAENLQEMGDSLESVTDFVHRVGYTFYRLDADGNAAEEIDPRDRAGLNFLAQPRGSHR